MSGCIWSIVCGTFLMSNFSHVIFINQCNVLVREQPNRWKDKQLTCITTIRSQFPIAPANAQHCHSILLYTESFYATLLWFHIKVLWWICCVSEGNGWKQWKSNCYRRIISGKSGLSLYFALHWLGNLKMSGCLAGRLTRTPATIRLTLNW